MVAQTYSFHPAFIELMKMPPFLFLNLFSSVTWILCSSSLSGTCDGKVDDVKLNRMSAIKLDMKQE